MLKIMIRGVHGSQVKTRDDAAAIAKSLVGDTKYDFFLISAEAVLVEVMMALHAVTPGRWQLKSLAHATASVKNLKAVLKTSETGREVLERYFSSPELGVTIIVVLQGCLYE